MRLDLFLKCSRITLRRTLAQKICESGNVLVNGLPAKPSHSVKPGDEITLKRRDKVVKLKVLSVPERRQMSKDEARTTYQLLDETVADDYLEF